MCGLCNDKGLVFFTQVIEKIPYEKVCRCHCLAGMNRKESGIPYISDEFLSLIRR